MNKQREDCLFKAKFPKISEAKIKEVIFAGPQIKQVFEDQDLSINLNSADRRAWKAFENVCRNFIGNEKAENYTEIVQGLNSSYSAMACNMLLKFHFIHSHLDFLH